jgi:hypothetical protein
VEKDEEKEKGIRGFCDNEGKGFQIVLRKVKVYVKSEIWL